MRGKQVVARLLGALLALMLLPISPAAAETIPLEPSHGVFTVAVRVNDAATIPFVLDSGAGDVQIPQDVFANLVATGTIGPEDHMGPGVYVQADGARTISERYLLHKMTLGRMVLTDIVVNVARAGSMPLLGQSFLARLPGWSIDNARHVLVLNDEDATKPLPFEGRWVAQVPAQGNCPFPAKISLDVHGTMIAGRITSAGHAYPLSGTVDASGNGTIMVNESSDNSGSIRFSSHDFVADYMNVSCGPRHAVGTRG
jgi:hypothetical protein